MFTGLPFHSNKKHSLIHAEKTHEAVHSIDFYTSIFSWPLLQISIYIFFIFYEAFIFPVFIFAFRSCLLVDQTCLRCCQHEYVVNVLSSRTHFVLVGFKLKPNDRAENLAHTKIHFSFDLKRSKRMRMYVCTPLYFTFWIQVLYSIPCFSPLLR